MPNYFVGTLDRMLADRLVTNARRRWPLLAFVPRAWLQPLLRPAASRLRRTLGRGAFFLSLAALAGVALVTLVT